MVQTLPLVIFHKETIMSELLSRLQINARLSLEPILRYGCVSQVAFRIPVYYNLRTEIPHNGFEYELIVYLVSVSGEMDKDVVKMKCGVETISL